MEWKAPLIPAHRTPILCCQAKWRLKYATAQRQLTPHSCFFFPEESEKSLCLCVCVCVCITFICVYIYIHIHIHIYIYYY
jgi:hypothetical protein